MDGSYRFYWNLARAFFGVSTVCAITGICFNSIIVITTIKTRSLRATYNILIAVCAFSDVVHQCGTLAQLPFLFDILFEIDSDICAYVMFLPEMGIGIGCSCILCIGLDRLLSVLFSLRYRVLNKHYYHIVEFTSSKLENCIVQSLGSIIVAYCSYLCFLMVTFCTRRVICEVMAPYADIGIVWFVSSNLLINVASSIVYFVIWIGLRSKSGSTVMKRIIKSLFIIVTVDVSGWILTPGLVEISQHIELEPQQKFAWAYFSIIFINLALSIKLPIYYSTSSEYRAALRSVYTGASSGASINPEMSRTTAT